MDAGSAFLQPIRDSEFLNSIKLRSAIPGGTCEFDLPEYFCWLSQPAEARMRAFGQWLGLLRPLCDAIAELLWLTRQAGRSRHEDRQGRGIHDRIRPRRAGAAAAHRVAGAGWFVPGNQRWRPASLQCPLPGSGTGSNARAAQIEEDVPVHTDHLRLRAPCACQPQ